MKISGISYPDINNGLGCRVTLWVSGCDHKCKGCQNENTWSKDSGRIFSDEDKERIFRVLEKPYIKGLTLSGGDPLGFYFKEVKELCETIKKRFPAKDIWCYTGFTLKDIEKCNKGDILPFIDVLVDGRYIEAERDTTLALRGSKNQIIWEKDDNSKFYQSNLNF